MSPVPGTIQNVIHAKLTYSSIVSCEAGSSGKRSLQLVEAEALRDNFPKAPSPKKQASAGDEKDSHNPGVTAGMTFLPLESLLMYGR